MFSQRASRFNRGGDSHLSQVARERFGDASKIRQGDVASVAAAVGVAAAVVFAVVDASAVVAIGNSFIVGYRRRSFGFVRPLMNGPVRVAIEAKGSVDALFFCFLSLFR